MVCTCCMCTFAYMWSISTSWTFSTIALVQHPIVLGTYIHTYTHTHTHTHTCLVSMPLRDPHSFPRTAPYRTGQIHTYIHTHTHTHTYTHTQVWVPCLYAIHTLFLVQHPIELGTYPALALGIIGVLAVYVNWDADMQKMRYVMCAEMQHSNICVDLRVSCVRICLFYCSFTYMRVYNIHNLCGFLCVLCTCLLVLLFFHVYACI
jgi:hypothetical protein